MIILSKVFLFHLFPGVIITGQVVPGFPSKRLLFFFLTKPMKMRQKQCPVKLKTQWDTDGDIFPVLNATPQMIWSWAREDEPLSWTATIIAFLFLLFFFF